jgi:serine/threonine-protein kinase PknK
VATVQPESMTACSRCRSAIPAGATFCPHCGARREAPLVAGPAVPGYTVLRRLGSGGAADVYLARQDALDRDVAIKVLRHDIDDSRQWRRFRREAQTIARLSAHPHVVTVHTAGRAESGQPYLVTEYLDRGSLADVLSAEGALPPNLAATVGVAIADALLAAHELGILHRDIKPANVLLGHDGAIKLGDFGIARLLEAQAGTTTDVIAFTPEHVAPELLRGDRDGPASDVYGLASTVAAALLGRALFRMEPDERVDAFLSRKVTAPPPALPTSVPPVLARPLMDALDPEPDRRPRLPDLRRQLAAAADELTHPTGAAAAPPTAMVSARPPGDPERGRRPVPVRTGRRPADRTRLIGVLAAAVLAAALVAAAVAGTFSGDERAAEPTTPTASAVPAPPAGSAAPVTPSATAAPVTATRPAPAAEPVSPATDPAPAAAPATNAPNTADVATVAPTASPPASRPGPTLLTPSAAERYVRTYYADVAAGDYERTWVQLAPEFQRGMAVSFEYYTDFWDDNAVELGAVELVDADADRAVVNAELYWNGSSSPTLEQLLLRRGDDGTILIAEQETVDD